MEQPLLYDYLALLPATDLVRLRRSAQPVALQKGDLLLQEGEVCNHYYFVQEGYLRTWYNKGGVDINLYFSFEGAFTTDLKSLKTQTPSRFNIEACEKTIVHRFERKVLSGLCDASPHILLLSRRLLSRLFMAMEEHSQLFKMYTPAERYRHIEQHNPQLLQRVSLSQLSSYLGVSRETLSRIRGRRPDPIL